MFEQQHTHTHTHTRKKSERNMSALDRKVVQVVAKTTHPQKTLASLCRSVIAGNLERYPGEVFAILDEGEFESIIKLRHERTRPQRGKGGLDGTGRMNPAVSDKFLSELEGAVPHLAQSNVVDTLVWKDIVQHKFKIGGLARPKGLTYPWPVLVDMVKQAGKNLTDLTKSDTIDEEGKRSALRSIQIICSLPMNVSLLKVTGIGKSVKKFLKSCDSHERFQCFDEPLTTSQNIRETPRLQLDLVLRTWMAMAAKSGVTMSKDNPTSEESSVVEECDKHLSEAENCKSWRELYITLKAHDENRRSNQGARMRERRKKLDSCRPKIVKVRRASSRQNSILSKQQGGIGEATTANLKMNKLRIEARVTSMRRSLPGQAISSSRNHPVSNPKTVGGFGTAVATFATGHKSNKRKANSTTIVELAGGKRMRIPDAKKKSADITKRLNMLKKKPPSTCTRR